MDLLLRQLVPAGFTGATLKAGGAAACGWARIFDALMGLNRIATIAAARHSVLSSARMFGVLCITSPRFLLPADRRFPKVCRPSMGLSRQGQLAAPSIQAMAPIGIAAGIGASISSTPAPGDIYEEHTTNLLV